MMPLAVTQEWDVQDRAGIRPRRRLILSVFWLVVAMAYGLGCIVGILRIIWDAAIHDKEPDK